mmetsp:Transcript_20083/g.46918  ORF Transcript_20083/g.46918 Transcript_20083/m.46918 type:complete len:775 (+) Transcript_20083:62-2386(+)
MPPKVPIIPEYEVRAASLASVEDAKPVDLDKPTEYETRTFVQKVLRFVHKGLRREMPIKIVFLSLTVYNMLTFWLLSLFLSWVADGEIHDFNRESAYYAGIIALGGLFSFILGLSGTLRSNTFEMLASVFGALLASSRIYLVLAKCLQASKNPKRCSTLAGLMTTQLIFLVVFASLVIKSFGWELYLKIGSHKHLRRAFKEYLLFATCMELDVILTLFLAVAGIAFYFDGIENAMAAVGFIADFFWSFGSYICIRREKALYFLVWFYFLGALVPLYLIYKIADVTVIRPGAKEKQYENEPWTIPRASLIMTAVMALVFRAVVLVYGYKCWKNFGIGLRERLDEIGVLFGGEEGERRRIRYKRDKQAGVNVGRKRRAASSVLGALSTDKKKTKQKKTGKLWSQKTLEERQKELKEVFEMFDSDGSGSIDADELFVAMKSMGQKMTKEEVDIMMVEMDEDGSGSVELDEFFSMMDRKMLAQEAEEQADDTALKSFAAKDAEEKEQQLRKMFEKFDADGSGSVDADEMYTAFRELGLAVTMDEVFEWVDEVDDDGSGCLDFEEFSQLITKKVTTVGDQGGSISKLEEMRQRLMSSVSVATGPANNPDADLMDRMQQLDPQRLDVMKNNYPVGETMKLAKEYKEISEQSKTERTKKLAGWWAKELVDRLMKQRELEKEKERGGGMDRIRVPAVAIKSSSDGRGGTRRSTIFGGAKKPAPSPVSSPGRSTPDRAAAASPRLQDYSDELDTMKEELIAEDKRTAARLQAGMTVDGKAALC